MDTIQNMIKDKMTDAVIGKLGEQFGLDDSKVGGLVKLALPLLLGGLSKNVANTSGATALNSALEKDHTGSILENLQDAIGGQTVQDDGHKILGHIFGDQLNPVEAFLSQTSGVDEGTVDGVLSNLAPIVLGQLGRSRADEGLDASGLAALLQGGSQDSQMSPLMSLLDRDNDGSVADDALELGKSFFLK